MARVQMSAEFAGVEVTVWVESERLDWSSHFADAAGAALGAAVGRLVPSPTAPAAEPDWAEVARVMGGDPRKAMERLVPNAAGLAEEVAEQDEELERLREFVLRLDPGLRGLGAVDGALRLLDGAPTPEARFPLRVLTERDARPVEDSPTALHAMVEQAAADLRYYGGSPDPMSNGRSIGAREVLRAGGYGKLAEAIEEEHRTAAAGSEVDRAEAWAREFREAADERNARLREDVRTAAEWEASEHVDRVVIDPDGWREEGAPAADARITLDEYRRRAGRSTTAPKANGPVTVARGYFTGASSPAQGPWPPRSEGLGRITVEVGNGSVEVAAEPTRLVVVHRPLEGAAYAVTVPLSTVQNRRLRELLTPNVDPRG